MENIDATHNYTHSRGHSEIINFILCVLRVTMYSLAGYKLKFLAGFLFNSVLKWLWPLLSFKFPTSQAGFLRGKSRSSAYTVLLIAHPIIFLGQFQKFVDLHYLRRVMLWPFFDLESMWKINFNDHLTFSYENLPRVSDIFFIQDNSFFLWCAVSGQSDAYLIYLECTRGRGPFQRACYLRL